MTASGALRSGSVSLRLYPHLDLEPTNTVAELRAQARLAEDAGFDGLMVSEHHNGFAGYLPNPIQAAGWLLEATESTWGRDAGPLPDDPAIQWCVANPIPVLSAANSPAACRRAAAADVGLLFDSLTAVDRCKALATTYREAGGHGPIALIRRASPGADSRTQHEQQLRLYRSYAPGAAAEHWSEEPPAAGDASVIAATLIAQAEAVGATCLNIRVHAPGLAPEQARRRIAALAEVVELLAREWRPPDL